MNLVKSLPLNNLLVGVVVPIAAAWISYYLAERAISKKENSRLYKDLSFCEDLLPWSPTLLEKCRKTEKK